MGIASLQVCMDSSDWLQDTIPDDCTGLDHSSSSPPGDDNNILTCNRPLIERRLRPQHEHALKCPRCDSTHTKFCYYNNYSLSQPRYFCKTCRRYWTKGGTLRNIPVGGGCRKNKKVSSNPKKSSNPDHVPSPSLSSSLVLNPQNVHHCHNRNTADIQLGFPEMLGNPNFGNPSFLLENSGSITPIDFMENNKYDHFMGNGENFGGLMGNANSNFHGINCSPLGFTSLDHHHQYGGNNLSAGNNILESCQRLMIPSYDENRYQLNNVIDEVNDVKPNAKILSLEWNDNSQQQQQQQACNSDAGNSFGYNFGGLGSWTGLMNGYGSSATNPLVYNIN